MNVVVAVPNQVNVFVSSVMFDISVQSSNLAFVMPRSDVVIANVFPQLFQVYVKQVPDVNVMLSNVVATGFGGEVMEYGVITKVAGEGIHAFRVVSVGADGRLYLADKDNEVLAKSVVGVALNSGGVGSSVRVKVIGVVSNPQWSWNVGGSVYLGNNGELVQTAPTSGYIVKIGNVIDERTIFVDIDVIIRAL